MTATSGSTTRGLHSNGVRKRSSTPGSPLIRCYLSLNKQCALLKRPKGSVQQETTTQSFAGIAVHVCCRLHPTYGNRNLLRSINKTHPQPTANVKKIFGGAR